LKNLKIIIITGHSGSGKSTAIAALEDVGFYCVDNLPVTLLPKFLELPILSAPEIAGLAFVMDLRGKAFLSQHNTIFESLRKKGYAFKILFLEASDEILLQRYSQTRRQHPLSKDSNLIESIRAEKEKMGRIRNHADKIIDTSDYNVHDLKTIILKTVKESKRRLLKINILSFGFKHGIPFNADLIMDVRFLANPYFIPELQDLTGEDDAVRNFILKKKDSVIFLKKYLDLLLYLIPLYEKEGKAYLTIAVGCTGGRHRSVTIARKLFEKIKRSRTSIEISHRDIDK